MLLVTMFKSLTDVGNSSKTINLNDGKEVEEDCAYHECLPQ